MNRKLFNVSKRRDHAMVLIDGEVAAFGHIEELSVHGDSSVRALVGA